MPGSAPGIRWRIHTSDNSYTNGRVRCSGRLEEHALSNAGGGRGWVEDGGKEGCSHFGGLKL